MKAGGLPALNYFFEITMRCPNFRPTPFEKFADSSPSEIVLEIR